MVALVLSNDSDKHIETSPDLLAQYIGLLFYFAFISYTFFLAFRS
jgi:hypothetical protein